MSNGGLFPARRPTGKFWHDHGLSVVLVVLMAVQTALALWTGAHVFAEEQPFGKGVDPWSGDFWIWWTWEYNVSLVADTFGVLLVVLLTKWLNEKGSSES